MKKVPYKKLILIIVSSVFLSLVVVNNFFFEVEVIGTYTPVDYKNNFDTIQLLSDHTYNRSIYGKNNKLILKTKGHWHLGDFHMLDFDPFLVNFDDDFLKYPESLSDSLNGWYGDLSLKGNHIQFCTGHFEFQYCYRKIK